MSKRVLGEIKFLLATHAERKNEGKMMEEIQKEMGKWIVKMFREMIPAEADPRGVF